MADLALFPGSPPTRHANVHPLSFSALSPVHAEWPGGAVAHTRRWTGPATRCVCRACNLQKGGIYYSALFEGEGERVKLPDAAALAEKGKLVQPINARAQRILQEREDKPGVSSAAGKVLGAALVPVAVPVFVLSLPFLAPDHWK